MFIFFGLPGFAFSQPQQAPGGKETASYLNKKLAGEDKKQ